MISLNGISKRISRGKNKITDNRPISVVDAGTNTFRLLIARPNIKDILSPILIEQRIVRLGEGFHKNGIINKEAEKRAFSTIADFYSIARRYNSSNFYVAGTSIFREAKNSSELILKIKKHFGISIDVLSSAKEAELSVIGCTAGMKRADKILLFDIGGGSTEFILREKSGIKFLKSLPLGVVHLTERFLKSDPPDAGQLNNLKTIIENKIERVYNNIIKINNENDFKLIGTAGTVTTIGAVLAGMKEYDRKKINMMKIKKEQIERLYLKLCNITSSERLKIPGIVKGREDLIVAGTALVRGIMDVFKKNIMYISDYGLLEGLALNFLESKGGEV
jgi:exopolyphosphatase/guanosine-5'-triphosphate,3'-diphosphate pyrophosphatase